MELSSSGSGLCVAMFVGRGMRRNNLYTVLMQVPPYHTVPQCSIASSRNVVKHYIIDHTVATVHALIASTTKYRTTVPFFDNIIAL